MSSGWDSKFRFFTTRGDPWTAFAYCMTREPGQGDGFDTSWKSALGDQVFGKSPCYRSLDCSTNCRVKDSTWGILLLDHRNEINKRSLGERQKVLFVFISLTVNPDAWLFSISRKMCALCQERIQLLKPNLSVSVLACLRRLHWSSTILTQEVHHDTMGHGPLSRYVKLRVALAPGTSGTFSPPPRVSDPDMHHGTCRGFLWSRWREKRSRHSRLMHNPQFCLSGKRSMAQPCSQ